MKDSALHVNRKVISTDLGILEVHSHETVISNFIITKINSLRKRLNCIHRHLCFVTYKTFSNSAMFPFLSYYRNIFCKCIYIIILCVQFLHKCVMLTSRIEDN
uniref:Uncharacterized protein n=1 Tax=Schistocephalus solidus TaxID=70667 RepID=A0A0V0JB79_SCHSO